MLFLVKRPIVEITVSLVETVKLWSEILEATKINVLYLRIVD